MLLKVGCLLYAVGKQPSIVHTRLSWLCGIVLQWFSFSENVEPRLFKHFYAAQ